MHKICLNMQKYAVTPQIFLLCIHMNMYTKICKNMQDKCKIYKNMHSPLCLWSQRWGPKLKAKLRASKKCNKFKSRPQYNGTEATASGNSSNGEPAWLPDSRDHLSVCHSAHWQAGQLGPSENSLRPEQVLINQASRSGSA